MRPKAHLVLGVALLLTLTTPVQAATPTPGAKCVKKNAKETSGGKIFTCITSGKKLVWNKGVAIAKPPAVVSPTPTPTPSAKPDSVATPEPVASPTPTPTQKNLTPLEKLNLEIYSRFQSAKRESFPSFNFVLCPTVDKSMADQTIAAYFDAYSFWAPIYKATAKVNWLLMSEKDWDCWHETTLKFEGPIADTKVWNKETGVIGHCTVSDRVFCGYGSGVRAGGIFAQYNLIGSNYKIAPTAMTVHHEVVHIYQMQLIADNFNTSKTNTLACWFLEGQANLFGMPIAFKGNPSNHRNFEKSRLLRVYPQGSAYTKEEWLGVLNDLRNNFNFCFQNELGYSLGWFALEWTYMNFSIEEMHNFLELITKGSTWQQAIESIMKMDEQTYLLKIAQYLSDEL